MITLAFGQMIYFVAGSLSPYGGDDGLTLKLRSTPWRSAFRFCRTTARCIDVLFLLASYLLPRTSPSTGASAGAGGARVTYPALATIGFDVFRYQRVAYAGCIGGLADFSPIPSSPSPSFMSWQRSGELIIMLFGGLAPCMAIVGAAAFLLLEDMLRRHHRELKTGFAEMLMHQQPARAADVNCAEHQGKV